MMLNAVPVEGDARQAKACSTEQPGELFGRSLAAARHDQHHEVQEFAKYPLLDRLGALIFGSVCAKLLTVTLRATFSPPLRGPLPSGMSRIRYLRAAR